MTTTLRLVGNGPDGSTPPTTSPLVRAEHDQRYVLRHVDREIERLVAQRPELRAQASALRDAFAQSVEQRGREFRDAGGRDYLGFAQGLARMRRELSGSLREIGQQVASTSRAPVSGAPVTLPHGRLDIRG